MSVDPCAASAGRIAAAIRAGTLRAADALEASLRRQAEVGATLNALVALRADGAREDAERADAEAARGHWRGPLHGVPMTVKDSLDAAGLVAAAGTLGRAAHVPRHDATVVARLRAAGAILIGKTNTPELTIGVETDNLVYGLTRNPYDPRRTAGGSSGGSAAAVAAGIVPFDVGSDTAGSLRWPAHCCGVACLKPTAGRVPRTGHALPPGLGAIDVLTQLGPVARHVDDLALLLPILCGPDGVDPQVVPMPLPRLDGGALDGLRVAMHVDTGAACADPVVAAVVAEAAAALTAAGATLERVAPPSLARLHRLSAEIRNTDGRAWLRRRVAAAGTTRLHPFVAGTIEGLAPVPSTVLVELLEEADRLRSQLLGFAASYPLVLGPVAARAAAEHGEWTRMLARGELSFTQGWNLAGWPAAVVRAGADPDGLPIGVQLVAPPWREDLVLAAARRIEAALGGWRAAPRPGTG